MKYFRQLVAFLIFSLTACNSTVKKEEAQEIEFVREEVPGYRLLDWEYGDMNKNDRVEFVLVVESEEPDPDFTGLNDGNHRKAVIAEIEEFPKFKVLAINEYIVDCSSCGGACDKTSVVTSLKL